MWEPLSEKVGLLLTADLGFHDDSLADASTDHRHDDSVAFFDRVGVRHDREVGRAAHILA
jgi:hypothetical protein